MFTGIAYDSSNMGKKDAQKRRLGDVFHVQAGRAIPKWRVQAMETTDLVTVSCCLWR